MKEGRTRFAKDIVAEYAIPLRDTGKVIIIASGMPSGPSKGTLLSFFAKKGFTVIVFRYRGAWESNGLLLEFAPTKDLIQVVDELPKGFVDTWTGEKLKPQITNVFILGLSFGGPAAIAAANHPLVKKIVTVSGVIDWKNGIGERESIPFMKKVIPQAFGEAYRIHKTGWARLRSGKFYNPATYDEISAEKILMIHAKDDDVVLFAQTRDFAKKYKIKLMTLTRGGHLSSLILTRPNIFKQVKKFLFSK